MANLADMADQIADSVEAQAANVENQLLDLEGEQAKLDDRKAKLLAARDASRDARKRLADYRGSDCPYCWIVDHAVGPLQAIGGGTATMDVFRCVRCDRTVEVDF